MPVEVSLWLSELDVWLLMAKTGLRGLALVAMVLVVSTLRFGLPKIGIPRRLMSAFVWGVGLGGFAAWATSMDLSSASPLTALVLFSVPVLQGWMVKLAMDSTAPKHIELSEVPLPAAEPETEAEVEERMRAAVERYREARRARVSLAQLRQVGVVMWTIGPDHRIEDTMGAGLARFGVTRNDAMDTSMADWPQPELYVAARRALERGYENVTVYCSGWLRPATVSYAPGDDGRLVAVSMPIPDERDAAALRGEGP